MSAADYAAAGQHVPAKHTAAASMMAHSVFVASCTSREMLDFSRAMEYAACHKVERSRVMMEACLAAMRYEGSVCGFGAFWGM